MKKAVKDKKKKEESFDPRAEQSREEEAFDELISAYEKGGEEELCKAIGCSMEELDPRNELNLLEIIDYTWTMTEMKLSKDTLNT